MTDQLLVDAADHLRVISRPFYDRYKQCADSKSMRIIDEGNKAYEKYIQLNKIAAELDIIAGGNL